MMKKVLLATTITCLMALIAQAGEIKGGFATWTQAGNEATSHQSGKTLEIRHFTSENHGKKPVDNALKAAIEKLGAEGGTIILGPGVYLFNESIVVPSNVVLQGDGNQTVLAFNLSEERDAIVFQGQLLPQVYPLAQDALAGDNVLYLNNTNGLAKGDILKLCLPQSKLTTSDWAKGTIAQFVEIQNIESNTVILKEALRLQLSKGGKTRINKVQPVENAGVSCLQILRNDTTASQTSNIKFNYAHNCFVQNTTSEYCNFAHVEITNSHNITVSGSFFRFANAYGGGGQGYGVLLQYGSSNCLVENNIFEYLRHAMILQAGANGNVLAYNYSVKPHWEETQLPGNSSGDLVLHGNYPFANLFEGNIVQNIVVDDSHGKNGPYNTFFKNTAELYGLIVNPGAADSLNLIGNQITNPSFLYGNYYVSGSGHYENGNVVKGKMKPEKSTEIDESSLYLQNESPFILHYNGKKAGLRISAEERYATGSYTTCTQVSQPQLALEKPEGLQAEQHTVSTGTEESPLEVSLYPNPAHGFVKVNTNEAVLITFIDMEGKTVLQTRMQQVDVSNLKTGIYIVRIETTNHRLTYQKVQLY
ncbi:T9SS type A sorting domain-containing protein [bacterium]|nr:T9SS type A sorting domain-containing protein [bacterium]